MENNISLTADQLEFNELIKDTNYELISEEEYNMLFSADKDVGYFQINNKSYMFKIRFANGGLDE